VKIVPLVWTTDPPTEPGWYWVRWTDGETDVDHFDMGYFSEDSPSPFGAFTHFAGPIPEPQEEE
jgi:hypothetical protein